MTPARAIEILKYGRARHPQASDKETKEARGMIAQGIITGDDIMWTTAEEREARRAQLQAES